MAWTAPKTFVDGVPLTAEDLNIQLRDNLLETAPAKARTSGSYFASIDVNTITERTIERQAVLASDSTTSSSYTDLSSSFGPEVTATTGTSAVVVISAFLQNLSAVTGFVRMSFAISGASSVSATDQYALLCEGTNGVSATFSTLVTDLTSGDNTFTMKYKTSSGTGNFSNRRLVVLPL